MSYAKANEYFVGSLDRHFIEPGSKGKSHNYPYSISSPKSWFREEFPLENYIWWEDLLDVSRNCRFQMNDIVQVKKNIQVGKM
jgi:hypothetical protein